MEIAKFNQQNGRISSRSHAFNVSNESGPVKKNG